MVNSSGGNFTLQSDQYGSASILAIPQNATHPNTYQGTFTVERYLSGQRGYRLIASPVYKTTVTTGGVTNKVYSLNYVQNAAYLTGTSGIPGGFDKLSQGPTLYLYREGAPVLNTTFIDGNYQSINNLNSGNSATPTYTFDYTTTTGSYSIPESNAFLFFFRGNRNDIFGSPIPIATETVTTYIATSATMVASRYIEPGADRLQGLVHTQL